MRERRCSFTLQLAARIGIGAGEPVMDGEALFGSTVNLTARICAQAEPGQILASRVVKDLCLGKDLSFSPFGAHELKGFDTPVELELVRWT
jgi:class 3 adenylate cyclase